MSIENKAKEEAGFTKGPWFWDLNRKSKQIRLSSVTGGCLTVMDFVRWGMSGASVRFRVGGIMKPADSFGKVIPNREHHADWCQAIDHPDAHLIAASPDLYEACKIQHECGDPEKVSLYDEEGIEGWTWSHPDGREWTEASPWDQDPPMHPVAAAALKKAEGKV